MGGVTLSMRIICTMVVLLLAATIGCGGGITGYELSGKVTYGGQPLPSGSIQFEPDGSLGAGGLCAMSPINDGVYAITTGGVSGGKYLVRINPPPVESGTDMSTVIQFPAYETRVDLPQANTTMDFDVPKKR
jgi:hypothetical protein